MAGMEGLEPTTSELTVHRSTIELHASLGRLTGLEPVVSSVTVKDFASKLQPPCKASRKVGHYHMVR